MDTEKGLSAETLGQIALIQGMVLHLPDRKKILAFVCRGWRSCRERTGLSTV